MGLKKPKSYQFVIPKLHWIYEGYNNLKAHQCLFVYYIKNKYNMGKKTPIIVFGDGSVFIYDSSSALRQFRSRNSKYEKVITIKL